MAESQLLSAVARLGFVAQGELPFSWVENFKQVNFRRRRVAKTRIQKPRFLSHNFFIPNGSQDETGTGGTAVWHVAYEYGGQVFPTTFNGATTGAVASGSFLVSDETPNVDIPAGAVFFERGYVAFANGMAFANNLVPNIIGGDCFEYAASGLTDRTLTPGVFTSSDAVNVFPTLGTIAMTRLPSLFWHGDSITAAAGDTLCDDTGCMGVPKVFGQFFGGFNAGVGGMTAASFIASVKTVRTAIAAYANILIQENTVNMLSGSVASIKADLVLEREVFTTLYPTMRAYMTTCLPSGSTSDAGATTANQTPSGNESKRIAINDWKRVCPEGWHGCIDIADVIEVNSSGVKTRNGGRFPPGMSSDMLHPSTTGYLMMKSAGGYLRSSLGA